MPMPLKSLKYPPVTVMSEASKSVDHSLKLNVRVATSPAFRSVLSDEMVIDGGTESRGFWGVELSSNAAINPS